MRTCALASNRARLIEMLATTAFVPSGAGPCIFVRLMIYPTYLSPT